MLDDPLLCFAVPARAATVQRHAYIRMTLHCRHRGISAVPRVHH